MSVFGDRVNWFHRVMLGFAALHGRYGLPWWMARLQDDSRPTLLVFLTSASKIVDCESLHAWVPDGNLWFWSYCKGLHQVAPYV